MSVTVSLSKILFHDGLIIFNNRLDYVVNKVDIESATILTPPLPISLVHFSFFHLFFSGTLRDFFRCPTKQVLITPCKLHKKTISSCYKKVLVSGPFLTNSMAVLDSLLTSIRGGAYSEGGVACICKHARVRDQLKNKCVCKSSGMIESLVSRLVGCMCVSLWVQAAPPSMQQLLGHKLFTSSAAAGLSILYVCGGLQRGHRFHL